MSEENKKYPRVGIGVMIQNEKGEVLLGLRRGSHGEGEWSFPGGHQDFSERMEETAKREVKEETGLDVDKFKLISVADEMRYIESDNKHYVNIGFKAKHSGGEAKIIEPDKWKEWKWVGLDNLPDNLFEGTELVINNFKKGTIYTTEL